MPLPFVRPPRDWRPGSARIFSLQLLTLTGLLLAVRQAVAADWPQWRYDAQRSAASPAQLPAKLHLQWSRQLPALQPAWPDQPRMQLDAHHEPVVAGKRLILGCSRTSSVVAYDTETGAEIWRFLTEGPVRFPPACWDGKVYAAADDGWLYCLDAARGTLLWKFAGAPGRRNILGNGRLISTWPARGAPVVADGTVYFAAGIWPFMGIFLHAVDAKTGKAVWTNDGDGAIFIKQPHNADSFAGVAPQGPLAVSGDYLIVPGGRSVPAVFDRRTGKLLYYRLAENGKRGGGSLVVAGEKQFFNGGAAFSLDKGTYIGAVEPLLTVTSDSLFHGEEDGVRSFDLSKAQTKTVETVDRKGKKVKTVQWQAPARGSLETFEPTALIKAGDRLYLGGDNIVATVRLEQDQPRAIVWRADLKGTVSSLLAADDRLFVVTTSGRLLCYGEKEGPVREYPLPAPPQPIQDVWTIRASKLLESTGVRDGWCVAWGAGSGRLVRELVRQSNLRVIVVEPDAVRAATLRRELIREDIGNDRLAVFAADPLTFSLPPYLASLAVTESFPADGLPLSKEMLARLFKPLRPYGGVAVLPVPERLRGEFTSAVRAAKLEYAVVRVRSEFVTLTREGALPGSANWTHEHADAANTRTSRDERVKAPLGVLWFGGPSHDGILPRHGHGPQPQVVDGRLFIEGVDMIRAMDVYTGRVLWETRLPGVGKFFDNLAHQPGANASGSNYVSTSDGIYVAYGKECLRLDPATGKIVARFSLPADPNGSPDWGYINVAGDYLIGGAEPLIPPEVAKKSSKEEKSTTLSRLSNDTFSSSKTLVVLDRHSGKVLWKVTARDGFRHNAICIGGGRLYAIDRLSGPQISRLKRRGLEPPNKPRLIALDLRTGKPIWQTEQDIFGTWLSYSAEQDILVEAGRVARDTILDEARGMRAYRAASGDKLWEQEKYSGPAMISGDVIHMAGYACDLKTGKKKTRIDPITGQEVEWTWSRDYGCNTPAVSHHLLTFRSGAAGFYDLCNDGGTANLGGFRSSCTNNLIVACGVLSAPDYTRTCVCNYQNQTSLALIHDPAVELWTYFDPAKVDGPVRRLGLNLGAAGDRKADDGTLWVEYPSVGGKSPKIPVKVAPEPVQWLRRHSSQIESTGQGPSWVASSAMKGASTLTVTLRGKSDGRGRYTVRLHFCELEEVEVGERLFDVALQGRKVLTRLDILKEAGGRRRPLVKEFRGIEVADDLTVTFSRDSRSKYPALLSGVELIEEK